MTAFLKQFGLPEALHSLMQSDDLPDDVWAKISEIQRRGSAQNFSAALAGAETMK